MASPTHHLLLLAAVCLALVSSGYAQPMPLKLFSNATARNAVCNDGSPAGYYIRPGRNPGAQRWLIFFQGGFWCWNEETCMGRWLGARGLMSSTVWAQSVNYGGILSMDEALNPAFSNATMVYVPYCSSDVFSGAKPKSATSRWTFQGRAILNALIEDLAAEGLSDASDVAVAGCSAGAQTVVVNLDYVASLIEAVTEAPVSGIMDAGWFLDRTPLVLRDTAPDIQFQEALVLWNGQVDQSCAVALGSDRWMCYFSPVGTPHLKTRFFMHTEQYDAFQVPWDIGQQPPYNSSQLDYAFAMRKEFQYTLGTIQAPNGVWSGACFYHCVSMGTPYYTFKINGVTMAEALDTWYNRRAPEVLMIDNCSGFNCTTGCMPYP